VYALDDHVWGIKITALEESTDSTTLNTEKLFSKLKSHKLSCKCHPNYDASFINNALITSAHVGGHDANPTNAITNKALITSAHVGGHDANPTNTISPSLKFTLSSLAAASDEQYKSILDDEIALLAKKNQTIHKFRKERRRSSQNSRGCFKCGDTTHFIVNCPKRKKYDYSNKNNYSNKNDYNNKNDYKKKNCFGDKKKKNIKKIMPELVQP
jgi:uncharacterized protein YfaS (alpha-2-macroglobulin family)